MRDFTFHTVDCYETNWIMRFVISFRRLLRPVVLRLDSQINRDLTAVLATQSLFRSCWGVSCARPADDVEGTLGAHRAHSGTRPRCDPRCHRNLPSPPERIQLTTARCSELEGSRICRGSRIIALKPGTEVTIRDGKRLAIPVGLPPVLASRETHGDNLVRPELRGRAAQSAVCRMSQRVLHRRRRLPSRRLFGHKAVLRTWLAWHQHRADPELI